jgi:chromosome segregation ATPase
MEEVVEYTRHYLRTSGSGLSTSAPSSSSVSISQQLQQTSDDISQLEQLLHDVEANEKNKTLAQSSHQRAHYHAILSFLAKLSQDVSQRYKFIRVMQLEAITIAKKLFDDSGVEKIAPDRLNALAQKAVEIDEEVKPLQEDDGMELTREQLQELESENRMLHDELDAMLEDAKDTEKAAAQIGDLVNIFQQKVGEQADQIQHLYDNALDVKGNMEEANENLVSAKEKATGGGSSWGFTALFRHLLLYVLLFAVVLLIFLDLVSS